MENFKYSKDLVLNKIKINFSSLGRSLGIVKEKKVTRFRLKYLLLTGVVYTYLFSRLTILTYNFFQDSKVGRASVDNVEN